MCPGGASGDLPVVRIRQSARRALLRGMRHSARGDRGRPPPEVERRHLCLVFCDLVGSTPLSQALDAEDLLDVLGSYRHACEAIVHRHDGFLAAYQGDGFEIYFGYPRAHEDDASRAVCCALDILDAIRLLAKATKVDLRVRIGIDSGRVVVGALGSTSRLAVGETPTLPRASRPRRRPAKWS